MPIKTSILIFLFELGFGFKFNIIGEISISELFLLVYAPLIIAKIHWKKSIELKQITIAYTILLCTQILSETLVSNGISSSLKGLAITIVSYLHFIFLFYNLTKDKRLILIVILSQVATKLFWGTAFEEQSAEDILAGEAATYLKFYIAPLTILIFLVFSIIFNKQNMPILFSLLGIGFVVLGARSSGIMAVFAGMTAYLAEHKYLLANKKLLFWSLAILIIISYCGYIYYVNLVLSGKIISGNNQQLLSCKNPYNPIELLMAGRSEVWVGWQAFMDKFWFGHGAWAYDTTGRYQRMLLAMQGKKMVIGEYFHHIGIPSHSVLIGSGTANGIFSFLSMGVILSYFLWKGILAIKECNKKFLLVLIYFVLSLAWNGVFSPQSHFRLTLPISFSIILTLYLTKFRNYKER